MEQECRRSLSPWWLESHHLIWMASLFRLLIYDRERMSYLAQANSVRVVIIIVFGLFYAVESNTNSWLLSWLGRGGKSTFHSLVNGCNQKQKQKHQTKPKPKPASPATKEFLKKLPCHTLLGKELRNLELSYSLCMSLYAASLYPASWIWMSITDSLWCMMDWDSEGKCLAPCPKQATDRIQIPWLFPPKHHGNTWEPQRYWKWNGKGIKVKSCSSIHSGVWQSQDWGNAGRCHCCVLSLHWHDAPPPPPPPPLPL